MDSCKMEVAKHPFVQEDPFMSYSHLSIIERGQIEALHRLGWSTREIGRQLGRHHSTIARELCRGQVNAYYEAAPAQDAYQERRAACVPSGKFTPELAAKLQEKLEQTWSPEQIAERRRCEGQTFVCFKTIYRWLYAGKLTVSETQVLRQGQATQAHGDTRTLSRRHPHPSASQRSTQAHNVRPLGTGYHRVEPREEQGLCGDVHRTQNPALLCGENAGSHSPFHGDRLWRGGKPVPERDLQDGNNGSRQGICLLYRTRKYTWYQGLFRRSLLFMATWFQ